MCLKKRQFSLIDKEFEYLRVTIEKLITNYQKDFQHEDDIYRESIRLLGKKHTPDAESSQIMECDFREPLYELEEFSSIIIESLIIKHLAYIEDILITFSFMVQKNENQVIPPNHNISGPFTDMLKAVEYIKLVTNDEINIKNTRNWKMVKLLRILRHKLAHGKRSFILKEGVIDDINREVPLLLNKRGVILKEFDRSKGLAFYAYEESQEPKNPKNEWNCSICSDIHVLKKINIICTDFIKEVKNFYAKKYDV